jgi:hypothetical protein
MGDNKIYQYIVIAGAVCAILVTLGTPIGFALGAFTAPLNNSMAQFTKDMAETKAQITKLNETFLAMPGMRDWNANENAIRQNRLDVASNADRLTKDEIEWSRVGAIVDRLADGTAAVTRRSR